MRERHSLDTIKAAAHFKGGECLSNAYANAVSKLDFRCREGHEWAATPMHILRGTWCPVCARKSLRLGLGPLRAIAEAKGGAVLSRAYERIGGKLDFRCGRGHEWATTALQIQNGHWCPTCARGRQMLGMERMAEVAAAKGGKCLSEHYASVDRALLWECAQGHRFLATPGRVMRAGSWCGACAREARKAKAAADRSEGAAVHAPVDLERPRPARRESRASREGLDAQLAAHAAAYGGRCLTQGVRFLKERVEFERADGTRWESFAGVVLRRKIWRV